MLAGGDQAYPAMIAAIDGARKTIGLQTYIFDDDPEGRKFVEALVRAQARGVEIRILIDAIGSKYSRPPITHRLHKHGNKAALIMTNPLGVKMPYANLRSPPMRLVVYVSLGFPDRLNFRAGLVSPLPQQKPAQATHSMVHGP